MSTAAQSIKTARAGTASAVGRRPLLLAFVSGLAGLAHQLLWTRRLVDLLGGTSLTFSRVVGAFFLGLALGAAFASIFRCSGRTAWRRVAAAELCVALLSIPALFSYEMAGTFGLHRFGGEIWQWLAPALLVAPPALCMGMVMPWMISGLERDGRAVGLYSANTLGGVAGILVVTLWGLPKLGLTGSGLAAASLNIFVALWAVQMGRGSKPVSEPDGPVSFGRPERSLVALSFASGFAVLGAEVMAQQQIAQVSINSLFSNAAVLGWVLVALAAAGFLVAWIGRNRAALGERLVLVLFLSGIACAMQPSLFASLRGGVDSLAYEMLPARYFWALSELNLAAIVPLFLVSGLVFPMVLRLDEERTGGRSIAVLLAWNGVGGWLGTEAAQMVISRQAGLWSGMLVLGGVYLLAAVGMAAAWKPAGRIQLRPISVALAVLAGLCLVIQWPVTREMPHVRLEPGEKLLECRVGPDGVVAAVERAPGDRRLLLNNTYSLGGTKAQANQERQAGLPILLHGSAKTVAVLGIATGSTVAGAAMHPAVGQIEAAELCADVLDFAQTHFGPWTRGALEQGNVQVSVQDARRLVSSRKAAFDVVVGDLFLPWRTGEGRMFTLEHFRAVKESLRSDGLFCQWLPLFQLTRPQYDMICRTFLEVFPEAILLRGDFYAELPIVGLVGGKNLQAIDWAAVERSCAILRSTGQVTDPLLRHADGVAMTVVGELPNPGPGKINTLGNAALELSAARNVVGLQEPWFIGVPCAEYIRDIHRTALPQMPFQLRAAHDAGQFCLTMEISAKLQLPVTENLMKQIPARFPRTLIADREADWQQWPTRVKPRFTYEARELTLKSLENVQTPAL